MEQLVSLAGHQYVSWIAGIFFVLPRVYVMLLVIPVFNDQVVTGLARNGIASVLAIFVFPSVMEHLKSPDLFSGWFWILILIKEGFIGLLLGFVASIFFWVMENIGQLIDQQTGSSNAAVFNPFSGSEGGPTSGFLLQLTVVLFVSSGGLLLLLGALFESYQIWPIMAPAPLRLEILRAFVIQQTDTLMILTIKLVAPVMTVLILIEYGLGLVSRSAQQLNVFSLSQPVKASAAVLIMAMMLTHVMDSMVQFLLNSDRLVQFFKVMGSGN
jgi:type III secretion protein T